MKNTGELKLDLPALPNGWQWNIILRERNFGIGPESELIVCAERGIHESDSGVYPYESIQSMPIAVDRHKEYDELIRSVQEEVTSVAERVLDWGKKEKTVGDAVKDVLNVFRNSSLHLTDGR